MSEFQGAAYERGDVSVCVGRVPERRQVALYTTVGNVSTVHAYFTSEESAEKFKEDMAYLLLGQGQPRHATIAPRVPQGPPTSGVRKLTDEEVIAARMARKHQNLTISDLAAMYRTSKSCMSLLLRGVTYPDVDGPIDGPTGPCYSVIPR